MGMAVATSWKGVRLLTLFLNDCKERGGQEDCVAVASRRVSKVGLAMF
jgi:hypothetical protein